MEQNRETFNKRAYIYSSFFHGALIVLMLNIPLIFDIEVPVFYELHLGSVSQQRMEQILEESRRSEAIRRLEVVNFPAIVAYDAGGREVYKRQKTRVR